ncbi:hypothetical protein COV18_06425 [Candidatus Woesearchaeota archaeon CG10_big_fil_rev_8_21_14_0_10_37_12]|nr:MAG: hypothetical protein COV18_06425 [Candidatus Woesearchaeota archaeon CG10_big_fil_rev_8_21_14_0_10_37_12]
MANELIESIKNTKATVAALKNACERRIELLGDLDAHLMRLNIAVTSGNTALAAHQRQGYEKTRKIIQNAEELLGNQLTKVSEFFEKDWKQTELILSRWQVGSTAVKSKVDELEKQFNEFKGKTVEEGLLEVRWGEASRGQGLSREERMVVKEQQTILQKAVSDANEIRVFLVEWENRLSKTQADIEEFVVKTVGWLSWTDGVGLLKQVRNLRLEARRIQGKRMMGPKEVQYWLAWDAKAGQLEKRSNEVVNSLQHMRQLTRERFGDALKIITKEQSKISAALESATNLESVTRQARETFENIKFTLVLQTSKGPQELVLGISEIYNATLKAKDSFVKPIDGVKNDFNAVRAGFEELKSLRSSSEQTGFSSDVELEPVGATSSGFRLTPDESYDWGEELFKNI